MKYDAVVIGSGMSGLTAALTLAQNGKRVAIVERCRHAAPLLKRFRRGETWFDPGFHYTGGLDEGGPLSLLFRYLKIRERLRVVRMKADGFDHLAYGEKEIAVPSGLKRVSEALSTAFPGNRAAVGRYIGEIESLLDATPFINYDPARPQFDRAFKSAESLHEKLAELGVEESLRTLLGRYGEVLYGVPGEEIPFSIHALIMGTFYQGAQTLERGGDELVEAFQARLKEEGADLLCGTAALSLETDGQKRLTGVRIEGGERLETAACIFTAHPQLLQPLLPEKGVSPAYLARLRGMENTPPLFTLYMEVHEVPERLRHSNLYRLCTAKESAGGEKGLALMACDPTPYDGKRRGMCLLTPSSSPPDGVYDGGRHALPYLDFKERETASALDRMLRLCPELEGRVSVLAGATPLTYERYTGTPGGSAYGVKQSVRQMRLNSLTSIQGLYLSGQSILMPGIFGAAISGLLTASHILGLDYIYEEVRSCR